MQGRASKAPSGKRRTYRRREGKTASGLIRDWQVGGARQRGQPYGDTIKVNKIERRVRRFLVIGVFADGVRVIDRVVFKVVIVGVAVVGIRSRIRIVRSRRVPVIRMRVCRPGQKHQRGNKQPKRDEQILQGRPPTRTQTSNQCSPSSAADVATDKIRPSVAALLEQTHEIASRG